MSATTIRLPDDLKARIARAAKRAGTTFHNFILEAIAEKADLAERRNDFHITAEARYADVVNSNVSGVSVTLFCQVFVRNDSVSASRLCLVQ